MPCYLFTYHAYGSWLPDHRRGYVQRHKGILPPNDKLAAKYRAKMKGPAIVFGESVQRILIEETLAASEFQAYRCHFLATEKTHVHVLLSWKIERDWQTLRAKLRESLTRRLNSEIERKEWFSKSPSRKRVKDQEHFDYLVTKYLPKHSGLKWSEQHGVFQ